MPDRKREIYIKLENVKEIVEILESIAEKKKDLENLFSTYDSLSLEENKVFENWSSYLEDSMQKLDHVTL